MSARILEAGDAALVLTLDAVIDPQVNAKAVAIARAVRDRRIPGVRDVVPTFRSVAVYFDPEAVQGEVIREALGGALESSGQPLGARAVEGRTIEVPVSYGGADGPDLADVASFAGINKQDVIELHAGVIYRVYMLGFLPGFAYMGSVDSRIAAPRKATPRLRVPAGSVGIAGIQTGIYPRESPGGWQIIGRTTLDVFDSARSPAALLAAGDAVRFVPA